MKQIATFGAGCFWCVEAAFNRMKGVEQAISGYMGDSQETANYNDVCSGLTQHAEVVQISFDPDLISYETLLEIFFFMHDPTQLNRQGNDKGPQYRSVIFYHNEAQKVAAETMVSNLNESDFDDRIVTQIMSEMPFYTAEPYHQAYYLNNPNQPYCAMVVAPKYNKCVEKFSNMLK